MSGFPFFGQTYTARRAVGTRKDTFTAAASVINPTELVTLTPNLMSVGATFRIHVGMAVSNIVTAAPTFTFQVMMGSVIAWTSGAITTNTTSNVSLPGTLDIDLTLDSVGSGTTAKFLGIGKLVCAAFAAGSTSICVPVTTPAVGTGFDSTIANILDFQAACGTSNALNGIQVFQYSVEQIFA